MKYFLPIVIWLLPVIALSQGNDSLLRMPGSNHPIPDNNMQGKTTIPVYKPEILTSGFIDIINNGQVNASARLIRLLVGEPGKFAIPLAVYSGVSSNNFQNQQTPSGQRTNEQLINSFINPLSGLANISIEGVIFFKQKKSKVTRAGFLYHGGIRVLMGYKTGLVTDPSTGQPINFLNSFGTTGLYFQTGAWERNNNRNVGVFWLAARYIVCKTGEKQLQEIIPGIHTNGIYHGWSVAWGVEINNLVNIKVVCYRYIKKPEINYSLLIYQFSFNYSLR